MLETACKQNVAKCGGYDIGKLGRFWSNKELKKKRDRFRKPRLEHVEQTLAFFPCCFHSYFRKKKSSMKAETIVSNQSSTKWIMFIHLGLSWMELDDSCLLLHRAVSQSVSRSFVVLTKLLKNMSVVWIWCFVFARVSAIFFLLLLLLLLGYCCEEIRLETQLERAKRSRGHKTQLSMLFNFLVLFPSRRINPSLQSRHHLASLL